jgi:hypothetical protein
VAAGGSVVVKPARNDTGEGKLTVTRIGKPSHGTAVLSSDGTVTYGPGQGLRRRRGLVHVHGAEQQGMLVRTVTPGAN